MKSILLCVLNAILMSTGQILFKTGAKGKSMTTIIEIINVMINPVVLVALVLYALTTVLWLYILSGIPLSYAQPITTLSIPIVAILSILIFNETVPMTRWIGIIIICVGVLIVSIK